MNGRNRAPQLFEQFQQGGEATIDKFMSEQVSEELFIDYKRVTGDGAGTILEQSDKENFARAVCGFGNSEGGIIIWGVECRRDPKRGDVPSAKHPVINVKRFMSHLEGATSGCTLPQHDGVRHHPIESGTGDGFVITLIPKSMFAPHQCIVGKYKDRYYMRVGSNFELVSHGLLAGMFGRQPAPNIFHLWSCGAEVTPATYAPLITTRPTSTPHLTLLFIIRNDGASMARDLFVNYNFRLPGPNCYLEAPHDSEWKLSSSIGQWFHVLSPEGYRLPPGAMVKPVQFDLYVKPPFIDPLSYEISYGCNGSPLLRVTATLGPDEVGSLLGEFLQSQRGNRDCFQFAKAFVRSDQLGNPVNPSGE